MSEEKVTVEVTLESVVDPDWIQFVTGGTESFVDVFFHSYCGYWMEGVEHSSKLGWLAYEFGAEDRHSTKKEKEAASKAWHNGEKLPKHFHALNLDLAKKAWAAGVKKYGHEWYENGDGITYDYVIQMALFNEPVYG